jgi:hypothetical protein
VKDIDCGYNTHTTHTSRYYHAISVIEHQRAKLNGLPERRIRRCGGIRERSMRRELSNALLGLRADNESGKVLLQ